MVGGASFGYLPGVATLSAAALADFVEHYTFIIKDV
jgi:hypothetical protein